MIPLLMAALLTLGPPPDEKRFGLTGPHSGLNRYAKALRKCGYPDAQIAVTRDGREYVARPTPPTGQDSKAAVVCEVAWLLDHQNVTLNSIDLSAENQN
jgi:hypothetical protein